MGYTWEEVANYCEQVYGWYVDREEEFFECCECADEPIYKCDWEGDEALANGYCPVCGAPLMLTCGKENWFDLEYEYEDEIDEKPV